MRNFHWVLFVLILIAFGTVAADDFLPIYEPLFEDRPLPNSVCLSDWIDRTEEFEETEAVPVLHEEFVMFDGDVLPVSATIVSQQNRRYSVAAKSFLWRDPARRRSVPVRIYHPSSRNGECYPIILFSHGLGGSIERCSYLGTAWASRGFVVVMLQHPGSDENVWRGKIRIRRELEDAYRSNWSGRTRALDLRFVLDRLEELDRQEHWLASIMNFDRIGVGGYDLGCLAALLVSGQLPPDRGSSLYDPRIDAVLAMSPPVNRPTTSFRDVYAPITIPALFITGTEDNGIIGSTKAHQRRIPFDSIASGDRYLITLRGADHRVYGGRFLAISDRNEKPYQALIARASSCFWLATLQQDSQSQTVLDGYGMNSLLGGMAHLERKQRSVERMEENFIGGESTKKVEKPSAPEKNGGEERQTRQRSSENVTERSFPLTRLYRIVSDSYGERL